MIKIIKKIIKIEYLAVVLFLLAVAVPVNASAATLYLQASRTTLSVGDTAVVSVKIDADGAVLNSVAGSIALKSSSAKLAPALVVQQFSLGQSVLGLWPQTPSLSKDGSVISFVGGVPGGFSIEGATLFNIIVTATSTGQITISPEDISVYANDGKGTKVPVTLKDLSINVVPAKASSISQNDWQTIVSSDKTPPQPFVIVLGQDPSIFGGKKFAFFSAVDNQSGIDHYEVSEDGGAYVRTGSTYVPQDQTDNLVLNVIAYDKAGNAQIATYGNASSALKTTTNQTRNLTLFIISAIVIFVVIVVVFLFIILSNFKKNKKHLK